MCKLCWALFGSVLLGIVLSAMRLANCNPKNRWRQGKYRRKI